VNAKVEEESNLLEWLDPHNSTAQGRAADIVVIGLQEMISLSATNVVAGTVIDVQSRDKALLWQRKFQGVLYDIGRRANIRYEVVAHVHMVGVFLCVFARSELLPTMSDLQLGIIPTGAGGLLGNKGACCMRLKCFDSSLCFVSAHLTAHRGAVAARNEDFETISAKRIFYDPVFGALTRPTGVNRSGRAHSGASRLVGTEAENHMASASAIGRQGKFEGEQMRIRMQRFETERGLHGISSEAMYSVLDHDVIIWVGDLNYRLIEQLDMDVSLPNIVAIPVIHASISKERFLLVFAVICVCARGTWIDVSSISTGSVRNDLQSKNKGTAPIRPAEH
jgi:hypothetical protein